MPATKTAADLVAALYPVVEEQDREQVTLALTSLLKTHLGKATVLAQDDQAHMEAWLTLTRVMAEFLPIAPLSKWEPKGWKLAYEQAERCWHTALHAQIAAAGRGTGDAER